MAYRNDSLGKRGAQPRGRMAEVQAILDSINPTPLLKALTARQWTGRPSYPQEALWRAYAASFILNLPSTAELIRQLEDNPVLRRVCGLPDGLPSAATFNRFIQILSWHTDLVDAVFADITNQLKEALPGLGDEVAFDSTAMRTHSQPNHKERSDPDARWGFKHSPQAKKDGVIYGFGYKSHAVCDANYGIPLAQFVLPANESDNPQLPKIYEKAKALLPWFQPKVAMGDKGYDAMSNHKYLLSQGTVPVIHLRKNSGGELRDGIYTTKGVPTCIGGSPMEYIRTDDAGRHLYRCPAKGCHKKGSLTGGSHHCADESWEVPADNIRWFGAGIRRDSPEWNDLYRKRWSIERLFGLLKSFLRLERHCVRGFRHISLQTAMANLAFQATILAQVAAGRMDQLGRMVRPLG